MANSRNNPEQEQDQPRDNIVDLLPGDAIPRPPLLVRQVGYYHFFADQPADAKAPNQDEVKDQKNESEAKAQVTTFKSTQ